MKVPIAATQIHFLSVSSIAGGIARLNLDSLVSLDKYLDGILKKEFLRY